MAKFRFLNSFMCIMVIFHLNFTFCIQSKAHLNQIPKWGELRKEIRHLPSELKELVKEYTYSPKFLDQASEKQISMVFHELQYLRKHFKLYKNKTVEKFDYLNVYFHIIHGKCAIKLSS